MLESQELLEHVIRKQPSTRGQARFLAIKRQQAVLGQARRHIECRLKQIATEFTFERRHIDSGVQPQPQDSRAIDIW